MSNFKLSTYEHLTGATKQTPAFSCVAQGSGFFYAKKGAMVADKGQFKYEKILLDPNAGTGLARGILNSVTRRLTGENMEIMKVTGNGMCILAWQGRNVTIVPLRPGEDVGVESENILAFSGNLKYSVRFIGSGVLSQKGLFTTSFKNNSGQDGYVAVITDGNAIVMETPCRVDPDAVICWTGPDPGLKADVNWKTFIGQTSGESYMFEFNQGGHHVVLQPSERKSGLDIGIDRGEQVGTQSSAFGNTQQNMNDTFGQVTNTLGNFFDR
ncbi:MAG: AIM24 family protein [Anaeromicrobium sp.]|jgi:uncharacterized protein (AIM24 family)|uniref:AIM24 family protein n=1 Tax=Anaeromicrobium sp. TaxID=1929132 RepID=UPI0025F4A079|nr:AIM24 family protein [Anaeromicrobium sp.]MCT4593430.1 AIM24 family protein [Anaeromicrobium sp.]